MWNSTDDSIHYTVRVSVPPTHISKRLISSEIAKIYDPLGLLGPVIINAKILLQKIWTLKVDWDESLPISIHSEWTEFYKQLPLLNNISFPRLTLINAATEVELHGFCDASERAYGACVYIRSTNHEQITDTQLLIAKSRVAPLKQQTIPRLELCGALLLTSLISTVQAALHIKVNRTTLWTDSTIVLHWLNTSPHLLKTFVANRVAEIQSKTDVTDWRHVQTADNPADLISRGQTPLEFLKKSIWHRGPEWLRHSEDQWPKYKLITPVNTPDERKVTCLTTITAEPELFLRFSTWPKLQRIIAYCLRWRDKKRSTGPITVQEMLRARKIILKQTQQGYFQNDLKHLSDGKPLEPKSKLNRLNPFLDKDGILRVGGRLKHSTLPFNQKHPIILPKSHITRLIINNEHLNQLHAGIQTTLYAVRLQYWPIDGRSQIWKAIKSCIKCCRFQPPSVDYIMGNLPKARVTESRPFIKVGVDYCGPFFIKEKKHRNRTKIKVYVAVFVCFSTKAVHLELVSDMTSEAFIAALRRFISRRGLCTDLYSDNGSNFVGANNQLQELRHLLRNDDHVEKIKNALATKAITWHFIPPYTPHFGGLWEAAVKSFKHHLRRVAGNTLFTFEEMNTLIIEIEAVLNSRPLTPLFSDPHDLLVVTPGHFLIGDSLMSLRERDYRDVPENRLSKWQHLQQLKQHFWTRWHREYLNELINRNKWNRGSHSIKEGTLVLLRDDKTPPMQWPMGRILKLLPGADGVTRTVTVRTASGTLDRSVKGLAPLPIQPGEEQTSSTAN